MSATVSLLNACTGGTVCAFAVALIARSPSTGYRGLIRVILTRAVAVSALLICVSSSLEFGSMPSVSEAPAMTVFIDALVIVDMLIFHAAALAVAHTAIRSIVLSLPVETINRSLAAHVRTLFALLWLGELCCAVTVTALGAVDDSRLMTKWLVAYRAAEIVAAACVMWYYIVMFRRHISFVFAATAGIEHSTEASTAKLDRFTRLATVMTFCFALFLGYHLYNLGDLTSSGAPSPYFHRRRLPSVLSLLRNSSLGALLVFLYATAREERTTRCQRSASARVSSDGDASDAAYWASSSDFGSGSVSDAGAGADADAGEDAIAGADAQHDLKARLLPSEAEDDGDHRNSRLGAGAGAVIHK